MPNIMNAVVDISTLFSVVALVIAIVALMYALKKPPPIPTQSPTPPPPPPPPPPKISMVDMAEFAGLDPDLARMYRDDIVKGIMPEIVQDTNKAWRSLPPQARTARIADAASLAKMVQSKIAVYNRSKGIAAFNHLMSDPRPFAGFPPN